MRKEVGGVSHRHGSNRQSRDEVAMQRGKGEEARRPLQEGVGDYGGRESFDLDFFGASRGKTAALGLQ